MEKTNKRIKRAKYVKQVESIFKCPICDSSMKVVESKSLICSNDHTFDFTKQGYINFLTRLMKTKYDKDLFEARRKLITESGFFEPLSKEIAAIINKQAVIDEGAIKLLDTGCGEGSHVANICDRLRSDFKKEIIGAGIDIAKEGILAAAKNDADMIWSVADLANTPFKDEQFDVILNILSPSNYKEFTRLLKAGGLVVKIVPRSDYLKELREAFYHVSEKQTYSNTETVERFKAYFQMVDCSRIRYTMNLDQVSIQSLVQMTPLSWSTTAERVQSFLGKDSAEITVDMDILIGRK